MVPFGFGDPCRNQPAHVQGIREKRLMGFEPTTFCMAIRPAWDSYWQQICPNAGNLEAAPQTATIRNACG